MKLVWILLFSLLILGCSDSPENKEEDNNSEPSKTEVKTPVNPEDLIEVKGSMYSEYYDAAKTKLKFQGEQDDNKQRHGRWVYYSEAGKEMSISHYKNGVLHGFMQVKRANGAFHYHGDFDNGERTGVWKFYDEQGKLANEINYDEQ